MAKVELIFHTGCHNLQSARDNLGAALAELKMEQDWSEWNSDDVDAPEYAKQYGSPTILIDGKDVANAEPTGSGSCCRVYDLGNGKTSGIPTVEIIKKRLSAS